MLRLSDYVIRFLENQNIDHVFTVTGGGSIFLCDALYSSKKIKTICCHHEQAVAMATESYARVRRSVGASLVTIGPGATNAITGVVGSWMDSVPHIIISGQAFYNQTIRDTGLRQFGVQEVNIVDLIKSVTKYAAVVSDPLEIKFHLEKALYLATTGRPGPVWLDLPANIQAAKIDENLLQGFTPPTDPYVCDKDIKQKVAKIVELLTQAKRPLVHVGQGVRIANAEKEFWSLIEKYKIPFVTARNANDMVASSHELFIGRPGTFPQRGANFAVQNADFYLAIGTRLSLPQTGYNAKDFAKNAFKVMVDVDKAELNKPSLNIDIKVHSDAKDFLKELNNQLEEKLINASEWIEQCRLWKKKYPAVLPEYKNQKKYINSYYFIDVLSDVLTNTDIVVTDMGIAFQGTHQAFRVKQGQKFFTNCGLASMGWGLPAAVGACIGSGYKRVICIAGEGGLMMNVQELATVMHHKLPIKIFVLNNGGYLTIKQTQQLGFEGRLIGVNSETGLSFPDMLKLALAHDIPATRLSSHDNLNQMLHDVVEAEGPHLCEIMMDPDQDQGPKTINRRNPDGTTVPTPLEDLYPYLDPTEVRENMIVDNKKK